MRTKNVHDVIHYALACQFGVNCLRWVLFFVPKFHYYKIIHCNRKKFTHSLQNLKNQWFFSLHRSPVMKKISSFIVGNIWSRNMINFLYFLVLQYINIEKHNFFINRPIGSYDIKKILIFLEVCLYCKLCVNYLYSVAVKDTIIFFAKFKLRALAWHKAHINYQPST